HGERRRGIVAAARALERIAAGLDLALDHPGLARGAAQIFEAIIAMLDLIERYAPVLKLEIGDLLGAIALEMVALAFKVGWIIAPGITFPVHPGAAHAIARQEGAVVAHRQ